MADVDQAEKPVTVHMLIDTMRRFIESNRHEQAAPLRFLAHMMQAPLELAVNIGANRLETIATSIADFRCQEIEKEKEQLGAKLEALQRDQDRIRRDAHSGRS